MITSQTTTETLIRNVVESGARLIVVACCNPHCRRYWFNELEERLPDDTIARRSECMFIRPDGRQIRILLDVDIDTKLRGLQGYELYRD